MQASWVDAFVNLLLGKLLLHWADLSSDKQQVYFAQKDIDLEDVVDDLDALDCNVDASGIDL